MVDVNEVPVESDQTTSPFASKKRTSLRLMMVPPLRVAEKENRQAVCVTPATL